MTGPPSSFSSGSTASASTTRTMSSSTRENTNNTLKDHQCKSTPNIQVKSPRTLKTKRSSFRVPFTTGSTSTGSSGVAAEGRGSNHSSPSSPTRPTRSVTSTTATTKSVSKRFGVSLMKFPKKLLSSGKYPKTKIVKDSIATLDDEIQIMTQDAPFIDGYPADMSICLLDRKEVVLGELLGEGQFAQVYNVKDLKLKDEKSETLSVEEQDKRDRFVHNFHNYPNTHQAKCCSYAVKHLKKDLLVKTSSLNRRMSRKQDGSGSVSAGDSDLPVDQQFQLAAADLVVEALYLSRIQHPHILRIRGMALGGTAAFNTGRYDSFFLVLDKLSETLDQRIRKWRHQGQPQESQLCQKTEYAHQMAQALEYLHRHRIIYRDLKPSNIGFKEQDDVLQVFDFGLCRELPTRKTDDPNEVYFLTAAGTHRYMAVEVHKGEQYNQKADVYSFAMVYYELLAQEAPFRNFSEEDHQKLVCERQHRPKHFFGCVVPLSIQKLLEDAWAHEIKDRLTMAEVVKRLEDVLINTFQQEVSGANGVVQVPSSHGCECCEKKEEEARTNPASNNMVAAIS